MLDNTVMFVVFVSDRGNSTLFTRHLWLMEWRRCLLMLARAATYQQLTQSGVFFCRRWTLSAFHNSASRCCKEMAMSASAWREPLLYTSNSPETYGVEWNVFYSFRQFTASLTCSFIMQKLSVFWHCWSINIA